MMGVKFHELVSNLTENLLRRLSIVSSTSNDVHEVERWPVTCIVVHWTVPSADSGSGSRTLIRGSAAHIFF